MKHAGFIFTTLLFCLTTPPMAHAALASDADRIAAKLWRVIDITKQYQPQFQAHLTLEAPDGERIALTVHGEHGRTLIRHDVITLEPKPEIPSALPEDALGDYFIPHLAKLGKTRWWKEWVKHEGQELSRAWKLFLLHKSGQETEL